MNKDKVLDNLMNIREWAGVVDHPATENEKDRYMHGIINLASETIKEVNSKPRMPKVFDDWASNYDVGTTAGLDYALTDIFNAYMGSRYEFSDLDDWFRDGSDADEKKYSDCVDALCNGYEVE
ncbi:hypothetical protein [Companilactobacillus keshanensis]|uniref:Phage protein n=1 Tax=Companilactobacillus keshanensis TaxID=2486003 RepID=A0ABW4BVI1_9LACO|nr:hypothetical protein [Companilactobacillus keshanensis]